MSVLPADAAERKAVPLAEGLLYYFPNALVEVARVSKRGNDQHNPGERMHWAMEKSTDHADCILRHLIDAGTTDSDGSRHTAKVAWRALALLETELLVEGAAAGRNAIRIPQSPDYDPASVAFRDGSAVEMAHAEGAADYGNPITPHIVDQKDALRELVEEGERMGDYDRPYPFDFTVTPSCGAGIGPKWEVTK